jgi:PAS domain S-box-containing protein
MKNILKTLILLLLFFVFQTFSYGKELKVGITKDMVPYSYIDENNTPSGIFVDYWKLWSKKSGIPIKFVASTWSESLDNLKKQNIDIHSGLFKDKNRENFTEYLKPIYNIKGYIYTLKKDIKSVADIKSIHVIKDSYYDRYMTQRYKKIKIIRNKDFTELTTNVMKDKNSSFISDQLIAWFNLVKYSKLQDINKIPFFELNNWFYSAVKKGDDKLKKLVLDGLSKITTKELIELEERWIVNENQRYFSNLKQNIVFTNEELQYIKDTKPIKVGIDFWEPFYYIKSNNTIGGIVGEYLKEISKISGLKFTPVKDKWSNLLKRIKKDEIDMLPLALKTESRESFGLFTKGYLNNRSTIYVHKNSSIKSLKDFENKKLAIVKGYADIEIIRKLYPRIEIIQTSGMSESIFKILTKEVDGTIEQEIVMENYLKNALITNVKAVIQNDIKDRTLHMFSKKSDPILNSILNKSLSSIPISRKNEIISGWLNDEIAIRFTKEELEFLKKHKVIKFSEINWKPISIVEDGKFSGLYNDYMKIVEEKTGLTFQLVESISWPNVIKSFKDKKIEFLPIIDTEDKENTNKYSEFGLVSKSYTDFSFAVVSKDRGTFINNNIDSLKDKTFALPKGYTSYNYMKKHYPNIKIIETDTINEALGLVVSGKAYAFLGHFAVSVYHIKNYFPDLKVIGITKDRFYHSFLVQKEYMPLLSIINKVIDNIPEKTKHEIKDRWIKVKIQTEYDYTLVIQISMAGILLTILIIIWNRKLKTIVIKRTHKLNQTIKFFDKNVIASKVDQNGKITYVSRAFCNRFGYEEKELLGKTHDMLRDSSLDTKILAELKKSYDEGKPWRGELVYKTKSGEKFWAEVKRKETKDEEGNFESFTNIFYDITNQKEIESLNYELNRLLDSFDDNVIASKTDIDGKIIYASKAFERISGYSRAELLNKTHKIVRHEDTNTETYKDLWETIKDKKVWRGEIKDKSKKGENYWLYTIITPEYDVKGDFLCYTAISQDITHEKAMIEAKEEIEQLNDEILETQKEVVFRMGAIAEARSKETGMHVKRVAEYSKLLALYTGIEKKEAEILKQASPMHDIGKVAIPDSILNKPGKFTDEEFEVMKSHAQIGYEMLKTSNKAILKVAAIVAHEHQEKYDGSGYPRGLKGDEIHIYGRITAIADVFDALGSDRCYKKAWNDERIFKMFKEESGKHFDPKLINIFFEHLDEFLEIRENMKDEIDEEQLEDK